MMISITEVFTRFFPKKATFIIVEEGRIGLECFADEENINKLTKPNQAQLKAFLTAALKLLEKKECHK